MAAEEKNLTIMLENGLRYNDDLTRQVVEPK
jgi:hypothetical protein